MSRVRKVLLVVQRCFIETKILIRTHNLATYLGTTNLPKIIMNSRCQSCAKKILRHTQPHTGLSGLIV